MYKEFPKFECTCIICQLILLKRSVCQSNPFKGTLCLESLGSPSLALTRSRRLCYSLQGCVTCLQEADPSLGTCHQVYPPTSRHGIGFVSQSQTGVIVGEREGGGVSGQRQTGAPGDGVKVAVEDVRRERDKQADCLGGERVCVCVGGGGVWNNFHSQIC